MFFGGWLTFRITGRYRIRQYRTSMVAASMFAGYKLALKAYESLTKPARERYRLRLEKVVQTLYSKEFEKFRRFHRKPLLDSRALEHKDLKQRLLGSASGAAAGAAAASVALLTTGEDARRGSGATAAEPLGDPRKVQVFAYGAGGRDANLGVTLPELGVEPAPLWVRSVGLLNASQTRNVAPLSEREKKSLVRPQEPLAEPLIFQCNW